MEGECKWRYAIVNGVKTDIQDAVRGVHGVCPLCGGELAPRKGEIRNWHLWHINGRLCDEWYEPKGEWHRAWQGCFEKDWQEVSIKKTIDGAEVRHIADVHTGTGWTIEFQYSHLNNESIRSREDFYGQMVWVVSGCRLDRDRALGVRLDSLPKVTSIQDGVPYSLQAQTSASAWFHSDKFVFFDFEGGFDCPRIDGCLYCLLPGFYDGPQIWAQIKKSDFAKAFSSGNEKDFLETIDRCRDDYRRRKEEADLRHKEEQERQAELALQVDAEQREFDRQSELSDPAEYAITLGWLQASLWVEWILRDCTISEGVDENLPNSGRIAIHYQNVYSKDDYDNDIRFVKEEYGHLRPSGGWPQYEHLGKRKGCIVAKARFSKFRDEIKGTWAIRLRDFARLVDYTGQYRILHHVPDGKGIWKLSEDLVVAVNDRTFKEPPNPPKEKKSSDNHASGTISGYRYTGKGNLYRDVKTNWLHILKNGTMIPLKAENQNWDSTYDSHFKKGRHHRW